MASRLIFLHHHDVLKQRGRPGIGQKVIGSAYPGHRLGRSSQPKGTGDGAIASNRSGWVLGTRKAVCGACCVTVPQTDTGTRGENPQACEITTAKELGKMTP